MSPLAGYRSDVIVSSAANSACRPMRKQSSDNSSAPRRHISRRPGSFFVEFLRYTRLAVLFADKRGHQLATSIFVALSLSALKVDPDTWVAAARQIYPVDVIVRVRFGYVHVATCNR